jgi:hypothetical protein
MGAEDQTQPVVGSGDLSVVLLVAVPNRTAPTPEEEQRDGDTDQAQPDS